LLERGLKKEKGEKMNFDFMIGWGLNPDEAKKLATEIEKRGYSVGFFVVNDNLEKELRALDLDVYNFHEMVSSLQISKSKIARYIDEYERNYNLLSMRDFCFTEACYRGAHEEQLFEEAIKYFYSIEKFIQAHKVGCFAFRLGGEFIQRVTYAVCKKVGMPVIYFDPFPPHFKGKMMLHTDEMNRLEDFTLIPFEKMSKEDRNFVDDFISSVKEKKEIQMYTMGSYHKSSICNRMLQKVGKGFNFIKTGNIAAIKNSMRYRLQNRIVHPGRKLLSKVYYSRFAPQKQYIFFPLHKQNDSQITIRNPQFYHQEWLVQVIAQSLPQGYKLYVKGHPGREYLPISTVRFISKIPDVYLLDPDTNPYDVTEHSQAVIIINSTVGFEALLYFKPVIVIGNWTLKGLGVTIDLDCLFDLRRAIKEAINAKVDKEKVKSVLFSLWSSMYEGSFDVPKPNLSAIADSLIKKLSRIRECRI